jgi:gluconolactonase
MTSTPPSTRASRATPRALEQPFVTHDRAFADVIGDAPRLLRLAATDAHEGPVYVAAEDALYFTTLPGPPRQRPLVAIKRLALDGTTAELDPDRVSVVCADARQANGMALGASGELIVCEQGAHDTPAAIAAVDRHSGARRTLIDHHRGLALNSPNDVVVASDGGIWFTDPSYGHLQGFRPPPACGDCVYRADPSSGSLEVVADCLEKPNGLAFSPDESTLYIGDSGANQEPGSFHPHRPHHILAFELRGGRRLGPPRLLAHTVPGFPDGIKVDDQGRVYASASSGVQVFNDTGEMIGEIVLAGAVNFCFGGAARNVLFITADRGVWAAVLGATGGPRDQPRSDNHPAKGA